MKATFALRTGACLTALMIAPAAWADVTAQQVWDAWQSSIAKAASGAAVTIGDVTTDGDTVTVTDFALNSTSDTATVTATIPQIVFAGAADGTVAITPMAQIPLTITYPDGKEIALTVTTTGSSITASGAPEDLTYDVAADQYVVNVDKMTSPKGDITGDIRLTLNNLTGTTHQSTGETRETSYDVKANALDLLIDVTPPEAGKVMLSGKIDGLAFAGDSSAPADLDVSDPAAMLGGDFTGKSTLTTGSSAYIFSTSGDMTIDGTATNGPVNVMTSVGPQGVAYDVAVSDLAADVTGSEMPFPFKLTAASYGFGLSAPVAPTDAPAPFSLMVDLTDVAVNDEVWAMIDPAANLPRDPATVRLDLSGSAQLDVALTDPTQMAAVGQGFPGKLQDLTLNELTIKAVGASVDGKGQFTFDNTDTTTFPGMPRPDGQIDLTVMGANGLIDKLIAMGLVPADQAMMGRMMLGMFAKDIGNDTLESTIEVKDGQVLANGQRIR